MKRAVLCIALLVALVGVASADTLTLYTTNSSDGYVGKVGQNLTFTELRNGVGTNVDINNTFSTVRLVQDNETDRYRENWRPALIFNGSAIPDDAIIQDASLGIHINFMYDDLGEQAFGNYSLVKFNIEGTINSADYDNFEWVRLAADRNTALITTGHYTNWSLNAAGLSNISKTGDFGFGFKGYYDMENAPPPWISGVGKKWVGFGFSAADSVVYPPFLEIHYIIPDITPPGSITGLGKTITCSSINWTWTNPADPDFNYTIILKDSVFDVNASKTTTFRRWTGLSESTRYTFSARTVDANGNVNATTVQQTAMTTACGVAPVVAFTADTTTPCVGDTVAFTDKSSDATAWYWEFGDGNTSTTQSPAFQYNTAGLFDVNLTATNAYGTDYLLKTGYIKVSVCAAQTPSEIGVYRGARNWYLDTSGNGAWGAGDSAFGFGVLGDIPVTGDWNSDGKTEIGIFRDGRTWYLDTSGNGAWGAGDSTYGFGITGDIPVTGDWTSDGKTEIGVFRGGRTWYLDTSGNGAWGAGDSTYGFGIAGDIPVTGDWNSDGKTEIGVFRGGRTWYLDTSGNGAWGSGDSAFSFGISGDKPVTGAW
ncbi:MAG: PKD domain-containing protein [Methanoregula sp.]|nr:PKD domain-containing protein [Methanoregula sp.]